MSRRPPSDNFTRFTSTSPHASKKPSFTSQPPSSSSSSEPISFNSSSSTGETPSEKVARLRAQSRLAKERATLSPVDRLIDRGRGWADRAHRLTTYGLLGLTGVSTVIAIYSLTSLVTHNRRQKRAWIERELDRLHEAQQAFLRGEADAEQLHLLEQERAGEEMKEIARREKEKKKAEGVWGRMKGLVGAGAAAGEMGQESAQEAERREARRKMAAAGSVDVDAFTKSRDRDARIREEVWVEGEVKPVAAAESGIKGVGVDEKGRPVPINKMQKVVRDVKDERRKGEDEVVARTGIRAGPLDVMAENVVSAVIPSGSQETAGAGWMSWLRGSKS